MLMSLKVEEESPVIFQGFVFFAVVGWEQHEGLGIRDQFMLTLKSYNIIEV